MRNSSRTRAGASSFYECNRFEPGDHPPWGLREGNESAHEALLTIVYMAGLIFRPKRQFARLGIDSIVVVLLYLLGVVGLVALQ